MGWITYVPKMDGPGGCWLCPLLPFFGAQKVWVNICGAAVGKAHPCRLHLAQPFTPLQSDPKWSQPGPWELRCPLGPSERCSKQHSGLVSSALMQGSDAGPGRAAPSFMGLCFSCVCLQLLEGLGVTLGQQSCGAPQAVFLPDTFFSRSLGLSPIDPLGFKRI